jgi:hypothetical protein
MIDLDWIDPVADRLAALYEKKFGGKDKGRYRIPARLLRKAAGRSRLYEDDVRMLSRAMQEKGFVLIDMDSFFVVLSANSFVNYRRANEDMLK